MKTITLQCETGSVVFRPDHTIRSQAFLMFCILFWTIPLLQAQETTRTCTEWFEPASFKDTIMGTGSTDPANDRPPVIFGESHEVPPMRVRIVDGVSGQPLETKKIYVWYYWEWLEYPYPEHAWGAWSQARDTLTCVPDRHGWIGTPAHTVKPRGWYDGVHTRFPWPRKPNFIGVTIRIINKQGYTPNAYLEKKDFRKFKSSDLVVRVFDGWRVEMNWQRRKIN